MHHRREGANGGSLGPMPKPQGTDRAPRRVLVVEDNPLLSRIVGELFEVEGFQVERAGDGEVALEAARERGPFDLVLCDVLLPRLSGTEVAETILREHPRTGVVLWSGGAASHGFARGTRRVRFAQKPLDAQQLMAVVADVLAEV